MRREGTHPPDDWNCWKCRGNFKKAGVEQHRLWWRCEDCDYKSSPPSEHYDHDARVKREEDSAKETRILRERFQAEGHARQTKEEDKRLTRNMWVVGIAAVLILWYMNVTYWQTPQTLCDQVYVGGCTEREEELFEEDLRSGYFIDPIDDEWRSRELFYEYLETFD